MSTVERLNNAIVALDFLAPAEPPGRREAIDALITHWLAWFEGGRSGSPAVDRAKLERYAQWYARAWALLPSDVQARALDPREIDPGWAAMLGDQIQEIAEAAQAAHAAGRTAADFVHEAGASLAARGKALLDAAQEMVEKQRQKLRNDVLLYGGMAIAGLLAWGYSQR